VNTVMVIVFIKTVQVVRARRPASRPTSAPGQAGRQSTGSSGWSSEGTEGTRTPVLWLLVMTCAKLSSFLAAGTGRIRHANPGYSRANRLR
jgi:hypothetical protein